MLEKDIEKKLKKRIEQIGGVCWKFHSGIRGVPDRIVIVKSDVYFVELKRPGEEPTPMQRYRHKRLRELGQKVIVIDTMKKLDSFIEELDKIKRFPLG